jgi:hypothetical protein
MTNKNDNLLEKDDIHSSTATILEASYASCH